MALDNKKFIDEFQYMDELFKLTHEEIPKNLSSLINLSIKHNNHITKDDVLLYIQNNIKKIGK